jgi:hypothetical protein
MRLAISVSVDLATLLSSNSDERTSARSDLKSTKPNFVIRQSAMALF